jgi:hypothetical protein
VRIQSRTPSNLLDQQGETEASASGRISDATAAVDTATVEPQATGVAGGS